MAALRSSLFFLLMMGLITMSAVADWRRRRAGGVPSLWWRSVARSFAAAGFFLLWALWWHTIWETGLGWRWTPQLLPVEASPENVETCSTLIGFCVYAAVGALLIVRWRPGRAAVSEGSKLTRLLDGFALLLGLAVPLGALWIGLTNLSPEVFTALGERSICCYTHVETYWVSPDYHQLRALALIEADAFGLVVMLFWLFQRLWLSAMGHDSDRSAGDVVFQRGRPAKL